MAELITKANDVLNFYKQLYKRKFLVSSQETFDVNAVAELILDIAKNDLSLDSITEILQKAIIWFLLAHDMKGKNGTVYPYSLRLLVQQGWLLKICIESTRHFDLSSLIEGILNSDLEKFTQALKSGKLKNNNSDSLVSEVQAVILKVESAIKTYELKGSELRHHPKIIKLYQNDSPSTEEVSRATIFLAKLLDRCKNGH